MEPADQGIVLPPGGGRTLAYPRGARMVVKASSAATGGAYALLEFTLPPGGTGSPPHFHVATEEAFYVIEGELAFTIGDRTVEMTDGSFILVRRGVVHTFKNTGARPTRMLILVSPGDFEGYFVELGELVAATPSGEPDRAAYERIARKYGQELVDRAAAEP